MPSIITLANQTNVEAKILEKPSWELFNDLIVL